MLKNNDHPYSDSIDTLQTDNSLNQLGQLTAALILLAIAAYALHGNSLMGYWRFDDPQSLDFSLHQSPWEAFYLPDTWKKLGAPFFTPLLILSYWTDLQFSALSPFIFYLHQLLALTIASWMTYILLRRWVPPVLAFLGSILFLGGLPTAVIAQQLMTRHYIEGLIFTIATLLCFFSTHEKHQWINWIGGLFYLVAMTAKEIYIPLFLFLFIISSRSNSFGKENLIRLLPYISATFIFTCWRFYMLDGVGGYTKTLIPSLDKLWQFLLALPHLLFAEGNSGWVICLLVMSLLFFGLWIGVFSKLQLVCIVLILLGPLLPVTQSLQLPISAEYFVPHRYMFLPWWVLSFCITLILSKLVAVDTTRHSEENFFNAVRIKYYRYMRLLPYCFLAGLTSINLIIQQGSLQCLQMLIVENEYIYRMA